MVYSRNRNFRRNRYLRRNRFNRNPRRSAHSTWKRYGSYAGSLAYKAFKTANFVRSIINTEYKFIDSSTAGPMTTTWTIIPVTQVAQGDDNNQRNGRSILAKSINARIRFSLAGSVSRATIRCMLVRYDACNGTNPSMTELLTSATDINAFRNLQGPIKNYTVLVDRRFTMDVDYKDFVVYDKYVKISDHVKYVGTAANTASMGNNNYFWLFYTDTYVDAENYVYLQGIFRTRFIDN